MNDFPCLAQGLDTDLAFLVRQTLVSLDGLHIFFDVAAQHNVRATPRHVGGDGDHGGPSGLRHDVGFARVLFGIQHLVRQLVLREQLGNQLGVFNRRGAHQHRLASLMAFTDVGNGGGVTLLRCLVDAVQLVFALALAVRWNDHGLQTVDFLKLIRFGIGCTRHAADLVVQAEIILEGDRGQGLVFGLNLHTLFGFNRLVQAITPASSGHQTAGELVHDDDLAVLHHIVLVTVVQVLRTQSRIQVVHQRDVGRIVQAGPFRNQAHLRQHRLGFFVTVFGQKHLV